MTLADDLQKFLAELRRLTQKGPLKVDEQARVCELTRLLLGTAIALSLTQPDVLTAEVVGVIEAELASALRSTAYLYLLNVADRLNDFLALRESRWFEFDERNDLVYLHVTLRNLEREISRESHALQDRERGFSELEFITDTCLTVYDVLDRRGYPPQVQRDAVEDKWSGILDVLNAIKNLRIDLSQEKEKFLRQASLELAKSFEKIEAIAHVTHAPLKPARPSWMDGLQHACYSCDAFIAPTRSELTAIHELFPRLSSVAYRSVSGLGMGCDATRMKHELRQGQLELMALETAEQMKLNSPRQVEYIREDFRLEMTHPGKCVAFIDEWQDVGGQQRLHRRVVEEADGIIELRKKIDSNSELKDERKQLKTRINEDPSRPIVVRPL